MRSNNLLIVLGVALVLVTAGCLGTVGTGGDDEPTDDDGDELPDADELLERSMDADSSVESVHGVQTVTWDDGDTVTTSTHEVWQRPPTDYRSELVESDEPEQFDVMVTNGSGSWMYDEADDEAVRMDLDVDRDELESLADGLAEALYENATASVDGTETVADRETYVLELEPDGDDAMYEAATFWIDAETDYPLKQEMTLSTGEQTITTTVAYEEVEFGGEIDDELFTFEPPANATVHESDDLMPETVEDVDAAESAVGFDVPQPTVPSDYDRDGVTVHENLAGSSVTLEYVDGDRILTVTVSDADTDAVVDPGGDTVDLGGVEATVRELDGVELTTVEWDDDGLSYTVSGELDTDRLVAVAESIVD